MNSDLIDKNFNLADSMDDSSIALAILDLMQDDTEGPFLWALSEFVRSRGVSNISKKTGLNRESLYKFVKNPLNCKYSTVHKILRALDINFIEHTVA